MRTFDDLTNTNFSSEISAADGRVESCTGISFVASVSIRQIDSLLSLLVCLGFIVKSSGVLHGDGVALLCFVDAVAGADQCLRDTHIV